MIRHQIIVGSRNLEDIWTSYKYPIDKFLQVLQNTIKEICDPTNDSNSDLCNKKERKEYTNIQIMIENTSDYDGGCLCLFVCADREETKKEIENRLKFEEKRKQLQKDCSEAKKSKELAEYKRLKKKYGKQE